MIFEKNLDRKKSDDIIPNKGGDHLESFKVLHQVSFYLIFYFDNFLFLTG